MIALIKGAISLILLILSQWFEAKKEVKEKREKIIGELNDAIDNGDASAVNLALSRMR
jgi:uncharacterized membrane protein YvbJ